MMPTHSGGTPSIFRPVRVSTMTMPRRITDCETQLAIARAEEGAGGAAEDQRDQHRPGATPEISTWPIAAASTSGTACTRSVPTRRTADRVG